MYVLGDDDNFVEHIIKLLDEPSDENGFVIKDPRSIRSRRSILHAPSKICSDTIRRLIVVATNDVKLVFVKRFWAAEDIDSVNTIIDEVKSSRIKIWKDEIAELKSTCECDARNERITQVKQWISTTSQPHSFLSFNESTFKSSILSLLRRSVGFKFIEQPASLLTHRPPVLHWSNFPCEDELQITFKFIFPFACLLDEELQAIVRNAVEAYSWQYNYQWSHGVLLKYDSVRIGVTQHGDNILEISGRIDIADLEDYSNGSPMRYVWPYLSLVVDIALKFFDKFSMPFQLYILPIGEIFYDNKDITARCFDLTRFLISSNLRRQVEFTTNDKICHINMQSLFGDIQMGTLNDLKGLRANETSVKPIISTTQSPSSNFLSTERIAADQHRYRRVSFGTIQCIPQQQSTDMESNEHGANSIDAFVDRFLDETLDEVLTR